MSRLWIGRLVALLVLVLGINVAVGVESEPLAEVSFETTCSFEESLPSRHYLDERDTSVAIVPRVQVGNTSSSNRTVNLSRYRSVASAATYHPQAVASSTLRGGTPSAHTSCVVPPLGLSGAEYHIFALRRIVI